MAVEDIGLADPQALVICNAAKDAYDFLGSPEGELAIAAGGDLCRDRAEIERGLRRLWRGQARRQGGRLAAAAQAHPQRADQADEVGRLRPRLCLRPRRGGGVLRPGLFPGGARPPDRSTIRPSAASSAKSGSAWNTGRNFARKGWEADADESMSGLALLRDAARCVAVVLALRGGAFVGRWAVKPRSARRAAATTPPTAALVATDTFAVVVRRLLPHRQDVQGQGGLRAGALRRQGRRVGDARRAGRPDAGDLGQAPSPKRCGGAREPRRDAPL